MQYLFILEDEIYKDIGVGEIDEALEVDRTTPEVSSAPSRECFFKAVRPVIGFDRRSRVLRLQQAEPGSSMIWLTWTLLPDDIIR